MIKIENLCYRFPGAARAALDSVNLSLAEGGITALLGANGAGKTTLVSILVGLLPLQSGTASVNNIALRAGRRDIALVPQDYAFYPQLSVQQNLDFFAGVLGRDKHRVASLLARCDLQGYKNTRGEHLSGGEKRRLNLAITLLQDASLLILDEPTANVDPHSRQKILNIVRELNTEGVSVLYTSHLLHEVQELCQHLVLMQQGKMVLSESMSTALASHKPRLCIEFKQLNEAQRHHLSTLLPTARLSGKHWQIDAEALPLEPTLFLKQLRDADFEFEYFSFARGSLEELFLDNARLMDEVNA